VRPIAEIGQVLESGLGVAVDAYGLGDGTGGGVGMAEHGELLSPIAVEIYLESDRE
jgi:hypothetical protein